VTFPAAGPDDDLRSAFLEGQVTTRLREADQLIAGAKAIMRRRPSKQGRQRAEAQARKALDIYRSALNWAEDTAHEEVAHARLDLGGRWVRQTFRCHLHREGSEYSQRCPVALGHNRIGLSVGGTAVPTCSLCGGDLSECEHRRGVAYLVPGGNGDLGWCRVCLTESTCAHSPDEEYRVRVVSMIRQMEFTEVSIVSKPAHPDARIMSMVIEHSDLERRLGASFVPGVPVSCDWCLSPCNGLTKHNIKHGRSGGWPNEPEADPTREPTS
jgi:hypothetical protein